MKKTLILTILALAALSCEKDGESVKPKGKQMLFGTVKEAALPEGSKIGLFVGSPVNYSNELLTVDASGAIVSSNELYWQSEQTQRSFVCAYAPYSETATAESITFSAKKDQSAEADYLASDALCYFNAAADPSAESIEIKFSHLFSEVELFFNNKTDAAISKVEIGEVATSASLSIPACETSIGNDKETIVCFAGTESYYAIIPPQTAALTVKVTLADSSVFEFELSEETFAAGKHYDNSSSPLKIGAEAPKQISFSFSVSDWVDGGELHLKGEETFDTIATLAATATTTETSFEVTLKNAVVTYTIGRYAHLEDASGAILIYGDSSLSEGEVLSGVISGKTKVYNGLPEITSIDFSKATKTTATELPLTTITLAELLENYDRYLSARVLLKDITISKGTSSSSRTGEITQGTSSIAVYATYTAKPAELEEGLEGDLIAFPTCRNTTKQLSIYESSQFSEGAGAEPEQSEFAQNTTELGFYSKTTDTPVAAITYKELKDQIATSVTKTGRTFSLASLEDNSWCMLTLDVTNPKIGSTGTATFVSSTTPSATYNVTVVNKTSTRLWLEDKTALVGFIIAL